VRTQRLSDDVIFSQFLADLLFLGLTALVYVILFERKHTSCLHKERAKIKNVIYIQIFSNFSLLYKFELCILSTYIFHLYVN